MTKLTVTLPDGTTGTRTTDKAYTHVVVATRGAARELADAQERVETYTRWVEEGYRTEADLADAKADLASVPTEDVWFASSWHSSEALAVREADRRKATSHWAGVQVRPVN